MSAKSIKILLIIFLLLVALLGVKLMLPKIKTEKSSYTEMTKGLSKDSVQKITLTKAEEKIELIKESGEWKVVDKKADKTKIESLLSFLLTINAPEEIAQTDKRHGEFELTDQIATKIGLDSKLVFLIGKTTGSSAYVRFDGNPIVYLLAFPPSFSTKILDWYDKTVVTIDKTKITKLSFKDAKGTLVLVKKDDKWVQESDSKEVKGEKLDTVFFTLSNLTAVSLYDEKSKIWYPKTPVLTLIVEYDSRSETFEFYKGESDYMVKRGSDGEQFVLSESSVSPLVSAPKEVL